MLDGRQDLQTNALEFELTRTDVVRAAIHSYLVPARHQTGRQMFGESFEAAVVCGNSPYTQDRDAHCLNATNQIGVTDSSVPDQRLFRTRPESTAPSSAN